MLLYFSTVTSTRHSGGRRVTRNGASTRPLEDEELLDLYLDREAQKFEARFQSTARRTIEAVDAIGAGLDDMAETLERLPRLIDGPESAASTAGYEAEDTKSRIDDIAQQLDVLERRLAQRLNRTPDFLFLRLRFLREQVWRCFNVDRVLRPSKTAERLAPKLLAHLNEPLDLGAYMVNLARLDLWEGALDERVREKGRPASMRWWGEQLAASVAVPPSVGQRVLVDDIEKFVAEYDEATTYPEVEWQAWDEESL